MQFSFNVNYYSAAIFNPSLNSYVIYKVPAGLPKHKIQIWGQF